MRRLLLAALLPALLIGTAHAQDMFPKPDDNISFSVSAEDWVTTKTARVTASIEAAVSATNAGTVRGDMMKAVNDLAKADWRLTDFNRSMDQTGLERWSTSYEARIPENELNGLNDTAKKLSKAGMQLTVTDIDFSPTLDETEAARAALRIKLAKEVSDQLASINAALPGRNYRISTIGFGSMDGTPRPMMRPMIAKALMAQEAPQAPEPSAERAEKITLTANVVLSALPPAPPAPPAH